MQFLFYFCAVSMQFFIVWEIYGTLFFPEFSLLSFVLTINPENIRGRISKPLSRGNVARFQMRCLSEIMQ